jgi:hypothetical protein
MDHEKGATRSRDVDALIRLRADLMNTMALAELRKAS